MSNILSSSNLPEPQAIAIGALGKTVREGIFHARFADGQEMRARQPLGHGETSKTDPVEQARADAFAEGFDAGMRIATENFAADEDARVKLAHAFDQLVPAANGALASMLSAAVIRLVSQIVGETPVNVDALARRVETVAAFIEEGQSRSSLHVNPDDIALLEGREFGFPLTPDADVARGGVRLETADGWIEDGPDIQISRLKAMLDDMEGRP
ncbi:MAG: FliH/SctL family protein [Sphingobium sp.]